MTMPRRDKPSIWSLVREDQDIDDIIFAGENYDSEENSVSCSER